MIRSEECITPEEDEKVEILLKFIYLDSFYFVIEFN